MRDSRQAVKEYQALLRHHADLHRQAVAKEAALIARREAALAKHDRRIADAGEGVSLAVGGMAEAVGPELTAQILEIALAEVRRCHRRVKRQEQKRQDPDSTEAPQAAPTRGTKPRSAAPPEAV